MTLYLKYRPKNLDELDEAAVSESLKKIVSKKNIPHAFLFAGPKGTGKTSAARILAKIINCENLKGDRPCDKCKQCTAITNGSNLDVVEMDAASHRGIDDVRILRDAVKLTPVAGKKKIYIIDEVHMLTTEASNALLKTLEEPPGHVIFILATTNPEKLIETIRSRTTLIPFKKANSSEIVRSLQRVVLGENLKIDKEVLEVIAEASDGSFRDAIKILEQLVAEDLPLTGKSVRQYLFKNESFDVDKFLALLSEKKMEDLLEIIEGLEVKGVSVEVFLSSLVKKLRSALLAKVGLGEDTLENISKKDAVKLIDLLSEAYGKIDSSPIETLPLELAIISWCEEEGGLDQCGGEKVEEINVEIKEEISATYKGRDDVVVQGHEQVMDESEMKVEDGAWRSILDFIKPINASMEALLRAAKPISYNGKVLTLGVYYKFHKERLEEAKHRKVLEEVVEKVLQLPTKVCCVLVDPPPKKIVEESKVEAILTEGKDKDIIKVAEEIFSN